MTTSKITSKIIDCGLAHKTLKLEINDLHKHQTTLQLQIFKINKLIVRNLPNNLYNMFFITQTKSLNNYCYDQYARIDHKWQWLNRKLNKRESIHNYKFKYFAISHNNRVSVPSSTNYRFVPSKFKFTRE